MPADSRSLFLPLPELSARGLSGCLAHRWSVELTERHPCFPHPVQAPSCFPRFPVFTVTVESLVREAGALSLPDRDLLEEKAKTLCGF